MAKEIQFILYNLPDNSGTVQAIVQDETIFLTQKAMAELFGVEVNTINYHLKEIFSSGELIEEATIRKIRTVQQEGNRQVEREQIFYSLDAIISVGYSIHISYVRSEAVEYKNTLPSLVCEKKVLTLQAI